MNIKLYTYGAPPASTPAAKRISFLLRIDAALLYLPFALAGYYCFSIGRYGTGILLFLVPLLVLAALAVFLKDLEKAYVLFSEHIELHRFFLRKERVKTLSYSDIDVIHLLPGYSLSPKLRGLRHSLQSYYVFCDADKKPLFKLIAYSDSAEAVTVLSAKYSWKVIDAAH